MKRLCIALCLVLLICGGVDYYQNQNIDRTLQVIVQAYETLEGFSDEAEELIIAGKNKLQELTGDENSENRSFFMDQIPEYSGEPFVVINDNIPDFTEEECSSGAFEYYGDLDYLGRCSMAEAMVTPEIMPTEERGEIGMVKPSGWHTVKYENIDGRYLYNRCHLLAYELTGENANEQNLITGTRYMNVTGMLPWENKIAKYVKETKGKVIYRVTPVFKDRELVARGVHMEAESIGSEEIRFNIFVYNVQPGIGIDYANGDSWSELQ